MEELRNVYQILLGQPEGNTPLEKPRNRRKDCVNTRYIEIWRQRVGTGFIRFSKEFWRRAVV